MLGADWSVSVFRVLTMAWPLVLLVSLVVSASVADAKKHDVIIVGAGVAGFTAAATLLEHNVQDVLVLESSDRIGGRINTVQFGGSAIDRGAEFVNGQEGNAVYKLASPHNLLTSYSRYIANADNFIYADVSGKEYNSALVKSMVDKGHEFANDDGLAQASGSIADYVNPRLKEVLKNNNVDGQLSEAIQYLVEGMECLYDGGANGLSEIGARGEPQLQEASGDPMLKWQSGGYMKLFDIISKKFPNPNEELPVKQKIKFGKKVTRVEMKEGEVVVQTEDGTKFTADHVIFTPSLGVLKEHAKDMFVPPLPADKTAAIEALGFGCVGKVFLQFPSRWWPKNIYSIVPLFSKSAQQEFKTSSSHGSWSSRTTGFYSVMNNEKMLCAWFYGDTCRTVEGLSEQELSAGLTELLQKLVGKKYNVQPPEAILRSQWASDPNVLGAYSYHSVESDQKKLSNSHLAKPVTDKKGNSLVLFAGEATDPRHFSTVHGAMETGRREASNILAYRRSRTSHQ